jgi:hypothetical protein
MKEITLKFREVAADGLPDKSCSVLTLSGFDSTGQGIIEGFYNMTNVGFSKKYGKFNQYDSLEEDPNSEFSKDVLFWVPVSEINEAFFGEDAQNV